MCCMGLILLQYFYWVSLFQCHFSHSCYDCSFWWVFPPCVLCCISPRQWVTPEGLCNMFCSADFFPCMCCVFSLFCYLEDSKCCFLLVITFTSFIQVTVWWLRLRYFSVLFIAMFQICQRVPDTNHALK